MALPPEVRLPHVQALGSHNSYHLEPAQPLSPSHRYSHPPLDEAADRGVRAFELDVHRADDGTLEVFHLPGIDAETTCRTLRGCLEVLLAWSRGHPCHTPLVVWLEPKDDVDELFPGYGPLTGAILEVDAAVREVWPPERLFVPDALRGARIGRAHV